MLLHARGFPKQFIRFLFPTTCELDGTSGSDKETKVQRDKGTYQGSHARMFQNQDHQPDLPDLKFPHLTTP